MNSKTASGQGPIKSLIRSCRAFYEHERWEPLQTGRNRKLISIAYVVMLGMVPLIAWLTDSLWLVMITYVIWVIPLVLLGLSTRGLTDRPMRHLDERERAWRRTVFSEPYWVGVVAGLFAALLLSFSFDTSEAKTNAILFVVFGVLWGIPNLTLAWRLPDGTSDDA